MLIVLPFSSIYFTFHNGLVTFFFSHLFYTHNLSEFSFLLSSPSKFLNIHFVLLGYCFLSDDWYVRLVLPEDVATLRCMKYYYNGGVTCNLHSPKFVLRTVEEELEIPRLGN